MVKLWKSLHVKKGKIVSGYDGSEWTVGVWRTVNPPTQSCVGLNCCKNIIDAMGYANMEILAEVEIAGSNITSEDKITSEKMRILRAWKWNKKDSVALASYSAGLVEDNFNSWAPTDSRVRDCNAIVRKWLEDPTSVSDDELRSAAESAGSAGSAAWSAAWSARSAAESAWSAESAAWSAAEWSARSAAESARSARSAAESAERQKMKNKIHRWVVKRTLQLEEIT